MAHYWMFVTAQVRVGEVDKIRNYVYEGWEHYDSNPYHSGIATICKTFQVEMESTDIKSYVEGFEQLFCYHVHWVTSGSGNEEWNWNEDHTKFVRVK